MIREAVGETANEEKGHCYDVSQTYERDLCLLFRMFISYQPYAQMEEVSAPPYLLFH